jgi:cytochrome bd-type quinol oxidase subunit 2
MQTWLAAHPKAHVALTAVYYFAIIATLLVMYGRGNFETPEFVYQDF